MPEKSETPKGVISAEDWDKGLAPTSGSEKEQAVLKELKKVGRGGMNGKALEEATNIKWLYGTINTLFKKGLIERKKMGRGYFYRLPQAEE